VKALRAALLALLPARVPDEALACRAALSVIVRAALLPEAERRRVRTQGALDEAIERRFPGAPPRPAGSLREIAAASRLDDVPLEALARAHAELQGLRLEGGRLVAGGKSRKRGGAFFTPPAVARVLAARTLAPVALGRGVVLDPAAGAGALVLASALFLLEAQDRETVASRVVGLEADPDAVLLARATLRERLGVEPRILHADALATEELAAALPEGLLAPPFPGDLGAVDAVIGNPPFVASYARGAVAPGEARRALVARRFPDLGPGEGNGFLHFLALALEVARPGGRVGLIVPDTLLVNERYERPRRDLLSRTSGLEASVLDWPVFGAASVRTALAIATRAGAEASAGAGGATVRVFDGEASLVADRPASWQRASARELEARPAFAFPRGSTDLALETKVRERGVALGDLCWVRDGINPGPRSFRDAILRESGGYPCLEGKDVSRYALAKARFQVRADPSLLTPELKRAGASFREAWIFDQEKLVSRQTSPTLVFARDALGHRFLNSAHATGRLPGTEESLHFFLGVLNSSVLRWYYARSSGETRRVFPQVHVSALRRLPVPRPDAGEHDAIAALARRLEASPDDADADRELDDRVAALFRLGPGDAARVAREVSTL
jgi:hypothetical protein